MRGGPIKNHRLLAFTDAEVSFRYRDRRGQEPPKWRTTRLPVDEFLDRLFEHVPVTGLHVVRASACMAGLSAKPWGAAALAAATARVPAGTRAGDRARTLEAPLTVIVSRTPVLPDRAKEKPTGPAPPVTARSNQRWSR